MATIDSGMFRNPNRDLYVNLAGTKRPEEDDYSYPKQEWWWTGKPPVHGQCPGVSKDGFITSLAIPDCATCSRQDILDYFDNTWTLTEVLFSGLQGREVFTRTPWHQLRHPLIFYYGHVACLYINKFRVAGLLKEGVNEYMEQIMETGVDEMSWDDLSKNEMVWPDLREVTEYRRTVYGIVKDVILNGNWEFPIKVDDPAWAIIMGFEHERIHLETSSVLMRELPAHLVTRPAQNSMVDVAGGVVELGKPKDFPSFGWDNEYGSRTVQVEAFKASKFLITNGEFLDFVKAGGYVNKSFWTAAGWEWRTFRNVLFPTFWVPDGPVGLHQYRLRLIFDVVELPMSWPVDCNVHEAKAFCNWKSKLDSPEHPYRLITEGEHNMLRDAATRDMAKGAKRDFIMAYDGFDLHDNAQGDNHYNSNLAFGSQSPVDALAASSTGFHDVFGNVWHWCEDDFNALDGFQVSPLYTDFSTPCLDGLHTLILGGSFISTGDEASIWSRFHFRPHFHQHAGFRMCSGPNAVTELPKQGTNGSSRVAAEEEPAAVEAAEVAEQLLLHYGARNDMLPWEQGPSEALGFPVRLAKLVGEWAGKAGAGAGRVLEVGCSVGGASFELANTFKEVVGVDGAEALVAAAEDMKREGQRSFARKEEGAIMSHLLASTDVTIDRTRCSFLVDDPCSLAARDYGAFDAVVVSDCLDRLHAPADCLSRIVAGGLVKAGGLVVVASRTRWTERKTAKSKWLGGRVAEGKDEYTLDGVKRMMGEQCELLSTVDMPLLIRSDARNYQFSLVEASIWKRK